MQRLLMEATQLVVNCHDPRSEKCEHCRTCLPVEVYGHLAAALRQHLVQATDERLKTLASNHFLNALTLAFRTGACRPPSAACPSATSHGTEKHACLGTSPHNVALELQPDGQARVR